jgi:hypothetical protein
MTVSTYAIKASQSLTSKALPANTNGAGHSLVSSRFICNYCHKTLR